ncbi:MAG: hypothetical protein RH948_01680 [Cyclobacteriaceae bacterium]
MLFNSINVEELIDPLFTFWSNKSDKLWISQIMRAFNKRGLLYYESEKEEMVVIERLIMSAIFYYEFCHRSSFHESKNFKYWSPELIQSLKRDFSPQADDNLHLVCRVMIEHFCDKRSCFVNIWMNCLQGANNIHYTLSELKEHSNQILLDLEQGDFSKQNAYDFLHNCDSIEGLESISI